MILVFHKILLFVTSTLDKKKKKKNRGVISKDLQSDFATMHPCMKLRQCKLRSLAVPHLNQAPDSDFMNQQHGFFFFFVQGSRSVVQCAAMMKN